VILTKRAELFTSDVAKCSLTESLALLSMLGTADIDGQRLNLILVKAFRDQLAFGLGDNLVVGIIGGLDIAGRAFNAKFFRGNPQHLGAGVFLGRGYGDVVGLGLWLRHKGLRHHGLRGHGVH
jgi:hypothetical protein